MLKQLEELYDADSTGPTTSSTNGIEVIGADELGAEVEQFLRDQE